VIEDCLNAAVKAGKLSQQGADEYVRRMKDAEELASQRGLTGAAAYVFAVTEAAKEMEGRATAKRAQVQQSILAIDRAWEGAKSNSRGTAMGLTDVLGERIAGEGSGHSIGQQHRGNLATIQSMLSDMLADIQSRAFGLKQNQVVPRHVVSELYGTRTASPDAGKYAKAWDGAMTWWRDEMARAGVFVRELADWRLPQHFDSAAVKALGQDGFVRQMETWFQDGKLRLRDWEADGQAYFRPGSPEAQTRVRQILERAYENITTGGDAGIEPGAVRNSTMADKYGRRRAFEWSTDEAWLEFNRTLGVGDDAIGEMMVRHMDTMSRELAVAQVLGPDPDRAAKILTQMYRKEGGSRFLANKLEALYEISAGHASNPVSQRLALGASAFRQFLASAQLGGALLSGVSDFAFTKSTAGWHGLEMTKVMGDYIQNLGRMGKEGRAQAMRDGLILEAGLRGLHDAARDAIGDVVTRSGGGKVDAVLNGLSRVTGRMAEVVIRAQGLAHHTQAMRDAIGGQVMSHLGSVANKTWDALSAVDRRTMETYGLGAADWDALRTKGVTEGVLDPAKLAREGEGAERDAGVKMLGAIAGIQRMAVPEGNAVTRALILGNTRPGTVPGEILRFLAQYQGFPMASMMMHAFRAMESLRDADGQWFRGQYIAGLVVAATVAGAASLQLKNLAAGKDPEPMWGDPFQSFKFWSYAAAQGGALGILGNQIKAMASAGVRGDPSRAMAPAGGFVADVIGLTRGNLGESIGGREAHAGRDAATFLRKYTPSVWYTRLAMDRLVWDTLQKMADPEAADTFSRMQERARREQHTEFFWRPGSSDPRAPVLSRATPGL
jgi:hypothetical protein